MGKKKDKRMKRAGLPVDLDPATLQALFGRGRRTGLSALRPSEQFLIGALIGAGALYLLGDEKLRGKLMKAGMRLYANFAGNFAEMQEQMTDIRAELAAEQGEL